MPHLFVSYSRSDETWVNELVVCLTDRGVPVWIDRSDMLASAPWRREAQEGIDAAELVLVCVSDFSRASGACAWERSIAENQGKRILEIEVGADLPSVAPRLADVYAKIRREEEWRTELRVRSRNWDAAGRPRQALAGAREQRLMRRRLPVGPVGAPEAMAYLAASRRRTVRRRFISAGSVFISVIALVSYLVTSTIQSNWARSNAAEAANYQASSWRIRSAATDPYNALETAATLGGDEAAVHSFAIEAALEHPVPDDAFSVPSHSLRFRSSPVAGTVVVTAADGTSWVRQSAQRSVRTARRLDRPGPAAHSHDGPLSVASGPGPAQLTVRRHGRLLRILTATERPTAYRLAPDQRWLAVAGATGVDIVDVDRGTVRTRLTGADAVGDVAWSVNGSRLWGTTGHHVVSWPVRHGTLLVNRPGTSYQALLPAADPHFAWLADRSGTLSLTRLADGTAVRTLRPGGTILFAAADVQGRVAVLTGGGGGLRVVDLATGRTRTVKVPCTAGEATLTTDATTAYVPCLLGDVEVVSTTSARVTRVLAVPKHDAASVAVVPSTGRVLVGGYGGDIYAYDDQNRFQLLHTLKCGPIVDRIAMTPDGRTLLPVGDGTGSIGCTQEMVTHGGHTQWNAVIDAIPDSMLARAAAYDPTGAEFVIGYSDGTMTLHPQNMTPREVVTDLQGPVSGMLVAPAPHPGGQAQLYVATREGMVERLALCPSCLSNAAMALRAHDMVERAVAIGLAHWVTEKPTPTATK
ncbi:toll/interleukin-1 receptor domain-containing protein [Streptomyces sp. NPDC050548]|uniref:toll/interleukin-1 receptor domain-containing protein n=1 Tax=Streptomyces sp. NPDC050548 TaxID=3365629 RepID=UPI0037989090